MGRCIGALALFFRALIAALLLAGGASPALGQIEHRYTNSTDSTTGEINDNSTPCSNPLTRSFAVSDNFSIADVQIGVLLAHTYRGDLRMYLAGPDGTTVTLTTGSGSNGGDNYNARFSDAASNSITSYTFNDTASATTSVPPYNYTYRPSGSLSAFDGKSSSGTWTLRLCDQYAQDSGTFYQTDLFLYELPTNYADLSLAMSASTSSAPSGSSIAYTLTIANSASSPLSASSVTVSAPLPAGLSYSSHSGGTYDPGTGTWTVGTLAPGASTSITITATITATAGATLSFPAEISNSSVPDLDSTPGNGSTTEDDDASASVTVSGTRTAGTPPALTCPNGTLLFDWDTRSWTAGSTTGSFTLTGLGSFNVSITNPATWMNIAAYGGQTPARGNGVTGGLSPAEYSLGEAIDFNSRNEVATTDITLGTAVDGAQFTIFDIDYYAGQFADRTKVYGYYRGALVTPVLTNGIANYVIGNEAFGDALSGDPDADGNVVVTFQQPIDEIVIEYGNSSLAPANPGGQAIAIHDITVCRPVANISVTKISTVLSDPVNGTTNPYSIPGAVLSYCIMISNGGSATATSIVASDAIPADTSYVSGSMKSGTSCANATTVEDDNAAGSDESDPVGASISGNNISIVAATLDPSSSIAVTFFATVN